MVGTVASRTTASIKPAPPRGITTSTRTRAWIRWVIFFFQAEDGIRDADVTGVQTCALPIWWLPARLRKPMRPAFAVANGQCIGFLRTAYEEIGGHTRVKMSVLEDVQLAREARKRSEERRVGKECRALWAVEHQKKRITGQTG